MYVCPNVHRKIAYIFCIPLTLMWLRYVRVRKCVREWALHRWTFLCVSMCMEPVHAFVPKWVPQSNSLPPRFWK